MNTECIESPEVVTMEEPKFLKDAIENQQRAIESAEANLDWIEANRPWLTELGLEPHFSGITTVFYNPKREEVLTIIRNIGGKWDKRYKEASITYSGEMEGRTILLCDSQPPDSCRLVPTLKVIPAHWEEEKTEQGFKLECRKADDEPAAEAETEPVDEAPHD